MSDFINDDFFEAVLRQAVIKNNRNEIASIPSEEELKKTYTFSKQHNKRMKKLFATENIHKTFTIVYKWGKVVVVAVCVSATLVLGTLLTSAEVRKAVGDVIVTWFEQFTNFRSEEVSEEFVEREWSIEYLPNGFYLDETFEAGEIKGAEYVNPSGNIIGFSYKASDLSTSIDNEEKKYNVLIENDIVYHLFESTLADNGNDLNTVVWDISGYRFTIEGNYDINELAKIALSVK